MARHAYMAVSRQGARVRVLSVHLWKSTWMDPDHAAVKGGLLPVGQAVGPQVVEPLGRGKDAVPIGEVFYF